MNEHRYIKKKKKLHLLQPDENDNLPCVKTFCVCIVQETSVDYSMMSEDENSIQEPSIKLDSSDEQTPSSRVSVSVKIECRDFREGEGKQKKKNSPPSIMIKYCNISFVDRSAVCKYIFYNTR